jgi:hypothetical protein
VAYRADVAVVLEDADAEAVCGIIAEVQLGIDPDKGYSCPPTELELRLAARGEAHGQARGQVEAKAHVVLAVLTARGLSVPDAVRARVLAHQDIEQLDAWLIRAVHAQHPQELLHGS